MSLAATLSYAGDFNRLLDLVAGAVDLLDGDERVAALSQQAGLLARAGRNDAALVAFTDASTPPPSPVQPASTSVEVGSASRYVPSSS